ncbi:MAG TPA: protein translocase subunit SecD [Gemmatimonadales bacterium]|nr:protein translocase subunit SecD [Gemmatimonadales bacterium]
MFSTIRSRLIVIAVLALCSIWAIWPVKQVEDVVQADGSVQQDTVERLRPSLGLDLQGGIHLGLELDTSKVASTNPARDIDLALTVLRKRIDEFGVAEPVIQKVGDRRIVVELAGIKDPDRAKAIVERSAFLEFRLTDKTHALDKALPAMDRVLRGLGITARSVNGAAAPAASQQNAVQNLLSGDSAKKAPGAGGKNKGADTTATSADTGAVAGGILESLIQPANPGDFQVPGEYMVPEGAYPRVDSMLSIPAVNALLPRNLTWRWLSAPISVGVAPYRFLYILDGKAIMTGSNLEDAQAGTDPLTQAAVVDFQLDRAGGRKFGQETGRHIGDYMAILLDNRVQGRPPVINGRIDRRGQITLGNKTIQEARDLALTLKAGALPVPLRIVEQQQVGASLGKDSIHDGILAGVIGTALVVLIMIGYYRLSGVLAVGGLMLYILFTIGGLAVVGATLSLPGLAGLVLSIGIAVDANVLIFERIREELDRGKTVRLSIDEGFKHAMAAIIDSNVTTVLTALFLFQFGTGPVKGFAVTLTLGIAASMVTSIFVVRTFYMIWLDRRPNLTSLSI